MSSQHSTRDLGSGTPFDSGVSSDVHIRTALPFAGSALASWLAWPLRRALLRLLREVRCGGLSVELPGGERLSGGDDAGGPQASIQLHCWRPLLRLILQGDLGLAASYRDGDWSSHDLTTLLEFGARNEAHWRRSVDALLPGRWLHRLFHRRHANTRSGSRRNIAFHYDLGNDFYSRWLSSEMLYSSALYLSGSETLEQAQAAKLDRIGQLLDVKPGDRVLEVGCGWGALAIALAERHPVDVTGITLSREQLDFARRRAGERGLTDRIDLRLQDYRDVDGEFDRIVSIEMLEAVGEKYWPVYFDTLRSRLRPGGHAVVQVITIADADFEHYRRTTDFIQRFIFPGGMLPSNEAVHRHATQAGLAITHEERFGDSYAATLVEWRRRFQAASPAIEALGFDAPFRRLWDYYLSYCEAGFRTGRVDVGLYRLELSPVRSPSLRDAR